MSRLDNRFIDEYGHVHVRDKELGRGGQGIVFRTRDPDVAVKVVLDSNGRPVSQQSLRDKLRMIRLLPLPANLNLSIPAAVLRDTAGYTMQLLSDMVSFKHFWPARQGQLKSGETDIPAWLRGIPVEDALKILSYQYTGGLRRRLLALYKCSVLLARLHAAGLVYGDVSPANAYISSDLSSREVWLIDPDNLRFEIRSGGSGVYTPGFGAPELVQGIDRGRPRTDCHAFAVLAFWMLTLQHPLIGDYVESGGEADWAADGDEDLEDKAYAGYVPWIHDEEDECNTTNSGLPRPLVLTQELMALFQETFGPGRTVFWRRPSIFHWPGALARALDQTIACPDCGMTYYYDLVETSHTCPFCGAAKPKTMRVVAYDWQGEEAIAPPAWTWIQEVPTGRLQKPIIPHRVFAPLSMVAGDSAVLELSLDHSELVLRRLDQTDTLPLGLASLNDKQSRFVDFHGAASLPADAVRGGFWLRSGGTRPRVVHFQLEVGADETP